MSSRYSVVCLVRPRAGWHREVARWASSAALPLEVTVAVSGREVAARIAAGSAPSALLADAGHPDLDVDLIGAASATGCATVVVDDGAVRRDWLAMGAAATLPSLFDHRSLGDLLALHAAPAGDVLSSAPAAEPDDGHAAGSLVAVLGHGGTGTSTVARAACQSLGSAGTDVLLADLALHADQAAAHDVGDVVPGLLELVDAHRRGALDPDEVRALTWTSEQLPYRLLLGLRRHRDWAGLRERATIAALRSLRRAAALVVADVDGDVEGEAETGSHDVEDRNRLARLAVGHAHLVLVTARPQVLSLRRLAVGVAALGEVSVAAERVVPVVVGAPRRPDRRAALVRTVAGLLADVDMADARPPIFVPWRTDLERAVHDGHLLPRPVAEAVGRPLAVLLERSEPAERSGAEPLPVQPGTLGTWWPTEEVGA